MTYESTNKKINYSHGRIRIPERSPKGVARLRYSHAGIAAVFITILVLVGMLGVGVSLTILTLGEQKILRNIVKSSQAYYTAEAGLEDALLRLKNSPTMSNLSYNFNVGSGVADISIPALIGGSRTVVSQGTLSNRIRKVQVVHMISSDEVSFHYGAQVGDGGMEMENNSEIKGNVFSNGNVVGVGGKGYIGNTITVARNGNKIDGLDVKENAYTYNCFDSTIHGKLTYVSPGGSSNCLLDNPPADTQEEEIVPESLPISQSQIQEWKDSAATPPGGGTQPPEGGNFVVPAKESRSLGPAKVEGNLIVEGKATLILTGTVWVAGDITIYNGAIVMLEASSYGSMSGVIIADGKIDVINGAILQGSGQAGSYIMLLSTNSSLSLTDPAIDVMNTATGAIFYTTQGLIRLRNNMKIQEATGYKIHLDNGAVVEYQYGLEKTYFTSGPGGGWKAIDWKEIK